MKIRTLRLTLALTFGLLALAMTLTLLGTSGDGPAIAQAAGAVEQAAQKATASTTVFTEGFEISVPPPGWIEKDVYDTMGNWEQASDTVNPSGGGVHGGSYLAYFNSSIPFVGHSTRIYTTNLSFSAAGEEYYVSLWMYHDTEDTYGNDRVQIEVDDGSGWADVGSAIPRYDGSTGWSQHTVDLSAYAGDVISLGIKGINDFGNDCHIDDVHVYHQPPTPRFDVVKTADRSEVALGATMTYTVDITNSGTAEATGTVLTDTLDIYQQPQSVATSRGNCSIANAGWGGVVTCTLGNMAIDATAHVTLTVQTTSTAPTQGFAWITNTVEAASGDATGSAQASALLYICRARLIEGSDVYTYTTVQAAIDAASTADSLVQVAGYCLGVENRGGHSQTAYINKTLTLRGGYSIDFSTWDTGFYATTLDAQGQGRVVHITGSVNPTVEGLHLTDGNAGVDEGGGVYIENATVAISRCQAYNNTANAAGGLYLNGGSATLISNTVRHNEVTGEWTGGGGLYLENCNAATLVGNTVSDNTNSGSYSDGGGLFLGTCDAAVRENVFTGNKATDRGGGIYLVDSDVTLESNRVSGNQATGDDGGGVAALGGNTTLISNTVSSNTSDEHGGGLYLTGSGVVTMTGNTIVGNTGGNSGGGVYLSKDATLVNNAICDNTAEGQSVDTGHGGGIVLGSGVATLISNTITGNEADEDGGGVYKSGGSLTAISNTVSGNEAYRDGGGMYLSENDTTLRGNTISGNEGDDGGGLYAEDCDVTLEHNDILSNTSDEEGGGLFLYDNDTITLTSNTVVSNTSLSHGGGLYLVGNAWSTVRIILISNTVASNWASGSNGGGLYLTNNDPVTMTGNTVVSNTADNGGGLYLNSGYGAPALTDNVFAGNSAIGEPADDGNGGGLYLDDEAVLSDNTVVSNTAVTEGGGLYLHSNGIALISNTVSCNRADDGGGVFLYYADLLNDNEIVSNTTSSDGGGLYLKYDDDITLIGNKVRNNTGYSGGGLYVYFSDATLDGNEIVSNTARNADGGGLYLHYSDSSLTGNAVISNTADGSGGGLYLDSSSAALMDNAIGGNRTNTGGSGGGLYLYHSDGVTMSGNVVVNNTAGASGGGLFVHRGSVTLVNNVVAHNRILQYFGSGVQVRAGTVHLLHTTIHDNTGGDGSGVYARSETIYNSTIWLTNTILVSQSVGVNVAADNTANINGVLWFNNMTNTSGTSVNITNEYTDTPAFAADGYHLTGDSAAIGKGVNAGVLTDIDGQSRPQGSAPDLGADEYVPPGAPAKVTLSGPITGVVDSTHTFTATVSPVTATLPITYTWYATGQTPKTHQVNGTSHAITFTWSVTGTQTITVTVANEHGSTVSAPHDITIEIAEEGWRYVYLPLVLKD
jgi:uncharacterized repeat protein (TIGR01451 family)